MPFNETDSGVNPVCVCVQMHGHAGVRVHKKMCVFAHVCVRKQKMCVHVCVCVWGV